MTAFDPKRTFNRLRDRQPTSRYANVSKIVPIFPSTAPISGAEIYQSSSWGKAMYAYEIYILQSKGYPSIITAEIQLSDVAAFRSARKLAQGRPFEVWRGNERLYPEAFSPRPEAPADRPAA